MVGELSEAGVAPGLLELAAWEVLFSAFVFVAVFLLTSALKRGPASLRHALWALVLLRLVLPVDLSHPFSLGALAADVWPVTTEASETSPAWPLPRGPMAAGGGAQAGEAGERAGGEWLAWVILALWAVGAGAVAGAHLRGRRGYWRVARGSAPVTDPEVLARLDRLKRKLSIRRRVRLVSGRWPHVPFTVGSVWPLIYLPRELLRRGDERVVEAALAHELAHVRRCDDLWIKLQVVCAAIYFFNPLVWFAVGRMRWESELACDELALTRTGLDPLGYGRGLLDALRLGTTGDRGLAPALGRRGRRMAMRLETIRSLRTSPGREALIRLTLPAAALVGTFLLPMMSPASEPDSDVAASASTGVDGVPQAARSLSEPMPDARITSPFGPAVDPFTGKDAWHRGIDVAGPSGSPVLAAADGYVEEATAEYAGGPSHGTVVIVDHGGGLKTFYSHLDRLAVEPGQRVARGDALGTQGSTGRVTGPHLHFEVWVEGQPSDPARFVPEWAPSESLLR